MAKSKNLEINSNQKIGVLTDHFIQWGGGVDFIRLIIKGISSETTNEYNRDVSIYILIPTENLFLRFVTNYIKRILNTFSVKKFNLSRNIDLKQLISSFKDVDSNIQVLKYNPRYNPLEKVVLKYNLDCLIPAFQPLSRNFPIPWIGYIYDFQHKYYPEFFSEEECKRRDLAFEKMLRSAKIVIVNAKSVKLDVEKYFKNVETKIVSLPFCPVLNESYFELNGDLSNYDLPVKYFLISNQFWKHKDHLTAIKAFSVFIKNSHDKSIGLVCTGSTVDDRFPGYFNEINELINELGLTENVKILGHIPKNDQIQILKSCIALIQPTLFEGGPGGFSVYESVSLGKPSIVSNIPVNKEIIDETVTFFEAGNYKDLARKMENQFKKKHIEISQIELVEKNNIAIKALGKELSNLF
jgi:glycosyltransferase involved in cell wall biosynthesis